MFGGSTPISLMRWSLDRQTIYSGSPSTSKVLISHDVTQQQAELAEILRNDAGLDCRCGRGGITGLEAEQAI